MEEAERGYGVCVGSGNGCCQLAGVAVVVEALESSLDGSEGGV